MGLQPTDPLSASRLAAHLGVRVLAIENVPGLTRTALTQLTKRDPDSWSAVMVVHRGINVVVMNTTHSPGRQSNSLSHECSHVILSHKPAQALLSGSGILISTYSQHQEAEADWLGSTLLLPRVALLRIAQRGLNHEAQARRYGVSDDLLRMRLDQTGVNLQMRRRTVTAHPAR